MDESREVETHEITEAEFERIHQHGSPHQHLDPTPHEILEAGEMMDDLDAKQASEEGLTSDVAVDYAALQVKQTVDAAKKKRDEIRGEVGEKLKPYLPKRVIPRYLRRALWSKDRLKLYKAIHRAKSEGWTDEEMTRQVRLLHDNENVPD